MAKTKRDFLKREISQAHHNIERALCDIQVVHEKFEPVHPDHAALLKVSAQSLIFAQTLLLDFWKAAWGSEPGNIEAWRL